MSLADSIDWVERAENLFGKDSKWLTDSIKSDKEYNTIKDRKMLLIDIFNTAQSNNYIENFYISADAETVVVYLDENDENRLVFKLDDTRYTKQNKKGYTIGW